MKCPHQFIPIGESNRLNKHTVRPVEGVRAGCILCGEIRSVFRDGIVIVEHAG